MNRFTLKFNDDKVEEQFQKSTAAIKQNALKRYAPMVCLITLLILINSILMQSLSLSIFSFIFLVIQLIAYYLIYKQKYSSRFQPLAMGIILSMSVILQIMTVIDNNMPHSDIDWIQDISILLSCNYVLSTDISWNFLFFISNLALRLYIRFEGYNSSILPIAFIICSLITFYNEYLRILNLRLEFELEEENIYSQNIFNAFDEKSIFILTYDHETMKFHLKFQNACSIGYFQKYSSQFLKTIKINKSNLEKHIFECIQLNNYLIQQLEGTYNKHQYNFKYQVSKSTQVQIFIIITKKQYKKQELVKPIFYKQLLMKVKRIDCKLFHSEVLKNLMYNIMKGKEYLKNLKFQEIQPQQLICFLQDQLSQARIICHIDHSINNNLLMIETVLLLIKHNLQVNQCTITSTPKDLISIILKGQILKLQISHARRQLFELILLRIGNGTYKIERSTVSFQLLDFKDLVPYQ